MGKQRRQNMDCLVDFANDQLFNTKSTDRLYQSFDQLQNYYYDCIMGQSVVMVDACAGTGKTTIAVMAGLELLRQGNKFSKIIYIRFPDDRQQKLGFLPGDQLEKEANLMKPFYGACIDCGIQPEGVDRLRENGVIELSTDIDKRGVNIRNAVVIIDEAQNGDLESLRLILTRVHDLNCKCIVIGHSGQMDSNIKTICGFNPFQVYQYHMAKKDWCSICELKKNYRGEISRWADSIEESIKELKEMQNIPLTNEE